MNLKTCTAVAMFFVATISTSVTGSPREDWAQFDRYAAQNAEIIANPDNTGRVVFLGNSITDNWPRMDNAFFTDNGFIGRGISGQTSYQFLSRFRRDVIELKPKIVVINVATNDVAENSHPYNQDLTFGNIESMVELAQANGIKVILTATLPAKGFSWRRTITDASEKIKALNERLKKYAAEHHIPFVDYYSAMVAPDGESLNPKYTKDGVHPTPEGYKVMEQLILPVIRQNLAK